MNPRNILLKSKSWKEFEKLIKPLNKTDKGFCFALLVRYYLLIDPQYFTKIKNDHVWFATSNPLIPERIKKHIDYPEDIGDEGYAARGNDVVECEDRPDCDPGHEQHGEGHYLRGSAPLTVT